VFLALDLAGSAAFVAGFVLPFATGLLRFVAGFVVLFGAGFGVDRGECCRSMSRLRPLPSAAGCRGRSARRRGPAPYWPSLHADIELRAFAVGHFAGGLPLHHVFHVLGGSVGP